MCRQRPPALKPRSLYETRGDSLPHDAYSDILRALEGATATLVRVSDSQYALLAVSLLARALIAHPAADVTSAERALQLSEILLAKSHGVSEVRQEEACFTQLLARVAIAIGSNSEDYENLDAIVDYLEHDKNACSRVLARLVGGDSFKTGLNERTHSRARLARCDLALTLMQMICWKSQHGQVLTDQLEPGRNSLDTTELLLLHENLPPEFVPEGQGEVSPAKPIRFIDLYLCATNFSHWELERLYCLDMRAFQPRVQQYVDTTFPNRGSLLFLRAFRKAKRIWVRNTFTRDPGTGVVPYPAEPATLSLEAALTKGFGPFNSIAMGGLSDPLGMARLHSILWEKVSWKNQFEDMVKSSDCIVVLPDETNALNWELRQLIDKGYLDRTMLIMVPLELDSTAERGWEHFALTFAEGGHSLPPYSDAGGFMLLAADGGIALQFSFDSLMDGTLGMKLAHRLVAK